MKRTYGRCQPPPARIPTAWDPEATEPPRAPSPGTFFRVLEGRGSGSAETLHTHVNAMMATCVKR